MVYRRTPIPKEILSFYDNARFDGIQDNIQENVIPNLINVTATRKLLLELVMDSVDVIGTKKLMNLPGLQMMPSLLLLSSTTLY